MIFLSIHYNKLFIHSSFSHSYNHFLPEYHLINRFIDCKLYINYKFQIQQNSSSSNSYLNLKTITWSQNTKSKFTTFNSNKQQVHHHHYNTPLLKASSPNSFSSSFHSLLIQFIPTTHIFILNSNSNHNFNTSIVLVLSFVEHFTQIFHIYLNLYTYTLLCTHILKFLIHHLFQITI